MSKRKWRKFNCTGNAMKTRINCHEHTNRAVQTLALNLKDTLSMGFCSQALLQTPPALSTDRGPICPALWARSGFAQSVGLSPSNRVCVG